MEEKRREEMDLSEVVDRRASIRDEIGRRGMCGRGGG